MHRLVKSGHAGFTLIEMAIVLVIIGLIVGGVLVGRDLIDAATVRAQISQIEKYNTAVNTFRGKYGALPGDMNATAASQFGFTPRGSYGGQGDGNGVIEGVQLNNTNNNFGYEETTGETPMFWVDLSTANGLNVNLIDGAFNTASINTLPTNVTGTFLAGYLPTAKIGNGNFVYVWSRGSINYYGISVATVLAGNGNGRLGSTPGMTVRQAYNIDKKMDDGMPQSGGVTAQYITNANGYYVWAAGGGTYGTSDTSATSASNNTCYDNGGVAGLQSYSVARSGGSYVNCALSFQFQ